MKFDRLQNAPLKVRFPSTERQLSERSTDRSGSIAAVRSAAGNGCNPSEAVSQSAPVNDDLCAKSCRFVKTSFLERNTTWNEVRRGHHSEARGTDSRPTRSQHVTLSTECFALRMTSEDLALVLPSVVRSPLSLVLRVFVRRAECCHRSATQEDA